jgi:hypothetical protein
MDVTKLPAPDLAANRSSLGTAAEQASLPPEKNPSLADRSDISPLDIPAALQILLAEVGDAFGLGPDSMSGATAIPASPVQAARALVEMVMQAMPDDAPDVSAWTAALVRVETALQTGLERALEVITAWRDVPQAVVGAAKESRAITYSVLGDEPQNPLWLRPEWAGLAPRLERFCRRRRLARRRLMDPDYSPGSLGDTDEKS